LCRLQRLASSVAISTLVQEVLNTDVTQAQQLQGYRIPARREVSSIPHGGQLWLCNERTLSVGRPCRRACLVCLALV
jgi:hypothetical protein